MTHLVCIRPEGLCMHVDIIGRFAPQPMVGDRLSDRRRYARVV